MQLFLPGLESCGGKTVERLDEDDLVPPNVLGVQISEEAEEAILKALNVQTIDRFQNMAEFKAALPVPDPLPVPDIPLADDSQSGTETNQDNGPDNSRNTDQDNGWKTDHDNDPDNGWKTDHDNDPDNGWKTDHDSDPDNGQKANQDNDPDNGRNTNQGDNPNSDRKTNQDNGPEPDPSDTPSSLPASILRFIRKKKLYFGAGAAVIAGIAVIGTALSGLHEKDAESAISSDSGYQWFAYLQHEAGYFGEKQQSFVPFKPGTCFLPAHCGRGLSVFLYL